MPLTGFRHSEASKAKIRAGVHKSASEGRAWVAASRSRALPNDVKALRQRLCSYRCAATRTGRSWELTEVQFEEITARNCYYCGCAPSQESTRFPGKRFNGIDRMNNDVGYVIENVVSCCAVCNRAKHTMGLSEFITLARQIAENHHGADAGPQCHLRAAQDSGLAARDRAVVPGQGGGRRRV